MSYDKYDSHVKRYKNYDSENDSEIKMIEQKIFDTLKIPKEILNKYDVHDAMITMCRKCVFATEILSTQQGTRLSDSVACIKKGLVLLNQCTICKNHTTEEQARIEEKGW